MAAGIKLLEAELVGLVKQSVEFTDTAFSVFSLDDLLVRGNQQNFPIAGVMYDGAVPKGNEASPANDKGSAASLVDVQFTVIIATQYGYSGLEDVKSSAFDLLDAIRSRVVGYMGVNKRPWRFVVEKPEYEPSTDGLVFYSQVWRTLVPSVGLFNNV
jgi:hypothetical protein